MARFSGLVGFGHTVQDKGVSREVITEKRYFGEVKRASLAEQHSGVVNPEIRSSNIIEIIAKDDYVNENMFAIRFVEWGGVVWQVVDITTPQRPRLSLRLGGAYHGPRAAPVDPEGEVPATP